MPTRVVNIRRRGGVGAAFDVYIGRSMYRGGWQLPGSKWANPYVIGRDGTRHEVIARFREYILENPELRAELPELRGKVLGCWCVPLPCHGEVLAELADAGGPLPAPPGRRRRLPSRNGDPTG